jgi:hypothetical protein
LAPEEIARSKSVYEDALRVLKLSGQDNSTTEILAKKIIELVQSGERNLLRIRALALAALGNSHLELAAASDLDQSARTGAPDSSNMKWNPIGDAPFDRDLELAVIDYDGTHTLVFPCRRVLGGWINAETKQRIEVRPSHWREWSVST